VTPPAIVPIDRMHPSRACIAEACRLLAGGGVVAYPSDTVYGLCCLASSRPAVERISRLKGYLQPRPFILLAPDTAAALSLADSPPAAAAALAAGVWPGPVTIVLKAGDGVPDWVTARDGTFAVRVPGDPISAAILAGTRGLLVSTSANAAGGCPPLSTDAIPPGISGGVDLVLDAGSLPDSAPSRILKPGPGGVEVLR
jgi:L-threonylcarbamoyladenylate synthase